MIFSRFRTPKYRDPRPEVRLSAIDKLDPANQEHKRILHELAFNDEQANVSLKALTRLDSFALWSKMADIAKDERVQKRARQYVEATLFEPESAFSRAEKLSFLRECKQNSLLEKALGQDWLLNEHVDDALSMLARLGKPHFTRKLLLNSEAQALQLRLLDSEEDHATLQKLVKKARSPEVAQKAKDKLDAAEIKRQKGQELEKQITLLLSQLRALRDVNDFDQFTQKRDALERAFEEAITKYRELRPTQDGEAKTESEQKFAEISQSLDQYQQAQLSVWQEAQRAKQQNQHAEKHLNEVSVLDGELSRLKDEAIQNLSVSASDIETLVNQFTLLSEVLHTCTKADRLSDMLRKSVEVAVGHVQRQLTVLQSLPQNIEQLAEASGTLDALKALQLDALTSEADKEATLTTMYELKAVFQKCKTSVGQAWPTELDSQWQAAWSELRAQERKIKAVVHEKQDKCRAKLRVVDSLVRQGKYNAAMALFSRVSQWVDALPEQQQKTLSRAYEKTADQVASLKGWQAYIAAPRKPELLQEALALAADTDQIETRAGEVKRLRQAWNSLGTLDTDEDTQLNQQFEQALETAFEPCRLHYAAEQAARAENLERKQGVIEELVALQGASIELAELARAFGKLQQRWRAIGHVDYRALNDLQSAYQQAVKPLEDRIEVFHQDNAEQKQRLLKKAESAIEHDSPSEAADIAKQLQQQWKAIGHAGKKAEAQLWQAFRTANDQIFAKLNADRQATRDEARSRFDDVTAQINALKQELAGATVKSVLAQCKLRLQALEQGLSELSEPARVKLHKTLNGLEQQINQKGRELDKASHRDQMTKLFDVVRAWRDDALPEAHGALPKRWQQAFQTAKTADQDRLDITLRMEIVAGVSSPDADKSRRNQIQLAMMADKLQAGEQDDLEALLRDWIAQGPLKEQDLTLLERVSETLGHQEQ